MAGKARIRTRSAAVAELSTETIDRASIVGPTLYREASFTREDVNEEKRTIAVAFSSEFPVERWDGNEILDHSKKSVRMARLNDGGPLLLNHDPNRHIGIIEAARIDKDRVGRAEVRFGESVLAEEVWRDVKSGVKHQISVGYRIHDFQLEEMEDGQATFRVTDWEPQEISIVALAADPTVGVNRATTTETRIMNPPIPQPTTLPTPTPEVPRYDPRQDRDAEVSRVKDIRARAAAIPEQYRTEAASVADTAVADGLTPDAFSHRLLTEVFKAKPVVGSPAIGMDQQEARSYSFLKAIRELAEIKNGGKGLTGLEREAHEAESKRSGRTSSGVLVPYDVLSRGIEHPGQHDVDPVARILARRSAMAYAQRALTSGVFASGGAFVPELFTGSFIELLRARQVVMAMGATALGGLSGDVAIPRLDGGATAYWLGEGTAVTGSTQTTGQLTLKPKRVGANTDMSVTFVRQTAFDGEAMVRDDLARVIAIAIDKAAFDGDGGNGEPLGIVNVDGIGAVTFGAAATWAKVVEFESTTETNLAALGTLGYVTSPGSKGKWKTISKDTGSGQFLWDGGTVNGYRAEATTQVPSNRVFFGNWPDLIVASWDTLELVVDPFTRAINHEIRVVAHALVDVGLRHAKSMTVSSDAGNQ